MTVVYLSRARFSQMKLALESFLEFHQVYQFSNQKKQGVFRIKDNSFHP